MAVVVIVTVISEIEKEGVNYQNKCNLHAQTGTFQKRYIAEKYVFPKRVLWPTDVADIFQEWACPRQESTRVFLLFAIQVSPPY